MYVFNQQSGYHCTRSALFDMRGPHIVKKNYKIEVFFPNESDFFSNII